jgi:hypothetical protein
MLSEMVAFDSGLWAAWVGALGTALAFMAAAIGFVWNLHATRRDSLISQARLFDVWVSDGEHDVMGDRMADITVSLSNASSQAIRNVFIQVRYKHRENHTGSTWVAVVPPTGHNATMQQTLLLSMGEDSVDLEDGHFDLYLVGVLEVTVDFTDAAGNGWSRSPTGQLTRTRQMDADKLTRRRS